MSQLVRQIVITLQVFSDHNIYHKLHSLCVGLLVKILAWSDQPYNSGYQDKLSISCMYTWWLDNNSDYLSKCLFVKIEC
jgi:hypothetical protein